MITELKEKVNLELEFERLQDPNNAFEASTVEKTKAPGNLRMKLNVISKHTFGIVPHGSKIQSIMSLAGHQGIRNLIETTDFTMMHPDMEADYPRHAKSRAVRAGLMTDGNWTMNINGRYVEVYGPYQEFLNVDGISVYTYSEGLGIQRATLDVEIHRSPAYDEDPAGLELRGT